MWPYLVWIIILELIWSPPVQHFMHLWWSSYRRVRHFMILWRIISRSLSTESLSDASSLQWWKLQRASWSPSVLLTNWWKSSIWVVVIYRLSFCHIGLWISSRLRWSLAGRSLHKILRSYIVLILLILCWVILINRTLLNQIFYGRASKTITRSWFYILVSNSCSAFSADSYTFISAFSIRILWKRAKSFESISNCFLASWIDTTNVWDIFLWICCIRITTT